METEFRLELTDWPRGRAAIAPIRATVFIREQGVPEDLEWDELDQSAVHVLAYARDGAAIGTARLLDNGHIGRMSVLADWRGRGVGGAMLALLVEEARRRGHDQIKLAAQVKAVPFYERHAFTADGEPFMDAGIPHRWMYKSLDA